MNDAQKEKIQNMRAAGVGYTTIANELGISANTVKSFCRRNHLTPTDLETVEVLENSEDRKLCRTCGKIIVQVEGRKEKLYCSDRCRNKWWNKHLDMVKKSAVYDYVCPHCKKPFSVYGNSKRKYCSHACYIADRFGGMADE